MNIKGDVYIKTTKEGYKCFCKRLLGHNVEHLTQEYFDEIFTFSNMSIKRYVCDKTHTTAYVLFFEDLEWSYYCDGTRLLMDTLDFINEKNHPYHLIRYTADFTQIDDFHSEGAFSVIKPLEFGVWNNEPSAKVEVVV